MRTGSTRVRTLGAAVALAVLGGCANGSGGPAALSTIAAAQPAVSPAQATAPRGVVTRIGSAVRATVIDGQTRTLVLLVDSPARLLLLDLDDLSAPARTVDLPGAAAQVERAGDGGSVLVALPNAVLRVDTATASTTRLPVDGDVRAVLQLPDGGVAAGLSDGSVQVLAADGTTQRVAGLAGVDELLTAGRTVLAVDRRQTAVSVVDLGAGKLGEALRAGEGATNAVSDRFGRALVTDTTGGELLAFSTGPLMLRQRYPVPGAPYALAYDPATDVVWVTLTATNEVVGYDVRGGEPQERYRFPTVTQPDSVAVDSSTGAVLVGSAGGDGVQRIVPGAAS